MTTVGDLLDPAKLAELRALAGEAKSEVPVEVPATVTVPVEVDVEDEADGTAELAEAYPDTEGKGSRASLDRSPKKNWVENAGELPAYIREVARAVERETGKDLSSAIAIAIGRIKRWAKGGGGVKGDTIAKAQAAVAAWEALKAKSGKAYDAVDEVKGPEQSVEMEHKSGGVGTATLVDADDDTGLVTALVSATNIKDRVSDIILPGAYAQTLAEQEPIGVWSHDDKVWVARAEEVKELMPGDPSLRGLKMNNGQPWPAEAGALMVKARFNLDTPHGAAAYSDVKFFKGKTGWSIGYRVAPGTRRDPATGVRKIKSLQLFEFSPVMAGAAPQAMTLAVKSMAGAHSVDPDEVPEPPDTVTYGEVKAMLDAREALEEKAGVRRVRSAAGVRQYGQPMGSVITTDSASRDRAGNADADRRIDDRAELAEVNKRRRARGQTPLLKLPPKKEQSTSAEKPKRTLTHVSDDDGPKMSSPSFGNSLSEAGRAASPAEIAAGRRAVRGPDDGQETPIGKVGEQVTAGGVTGELVAYNESTGKMAIRDAKMKLHILPIPAGKKDDLADLEVKASRMLAEGNIAEVMDAHDRLGALLVQAGVLDEADDQPKGWGPEAWASEALDLAERLSVAGDEVGRKAALVLADTQLEVLGVEVKHADPAGVFEEEDVEDVSELLSRGAELKTLLGLPEPPPFV